jgi:hypothetical protein
MVGSRSSLTREERGVGEGVRKGGVERSGGHA